MQRLKDKAAGSVLEMVSPFAATCRAELMTGAGEYSRCLVNTNIFCGYRSHPFNLASFCLHPRHKEIVTRTAAK